MGWFTLFTNAFVPKHVSWPFHLSQIPQKKSLLVGTINIYCFTWMRENFFYLGFVVVAAAALSILSRAVFCRQTHTLLFNNFQFYLFYEKMLISPILITALTKFVVDQLIKFLLQLNEKKCRSFLAFCLVCAKSIFEILCNEMDEDSTKSCLCKCSADIFFLLSVARSVFVWVPRVFFSLVALKHSQALLLFFIFSISLSRLEKSSV